MKYTKTILLSALCAALPTRQTQCAAEAELPHARNQEYFNQGYFDVEAFVEQVENGELSDDEIRENLNRQNPSRQGPWHAREENYSTYTPAIQAVCYKKMNALATLIRLGADLHRADEDGFTPLILAAQENSEKPLSMLLDAGAIVDFQGIDNNTALARAAHMGRLPAVQTLIAAGAKLDIQNDYGQTALIEAIRKLRPSPEVVHALLDAKADTSIVDNYGKTASVHARDSRNYPNEIAAITQMLVAAGAQPEQEMAHLRQEENLSNYRLGALATVCKAVAPHQDYSPEPADGGPVNQANRNFEPENAQVVAQAADDGEPEGQGAEFCVLL